MQRQDFEAELLRDPDATTPYLVYADWMLERGEEHGRLIAVQHALDGQPRDRALWDEQERLCAKMLAPLGDLVKRCTFGWRRGFVRQLRIPYDPEPIGAEVLRKLLRLPVGMLLQDLTVGIDAADLAAGDVTEVLATFSPPLTRLFLGEFASPTGDLNGISWLNVGDVEPLWKGLPRLRDLTLMGLSKLGRIEHAGLRRFELRTGNLERARLDAIISARWPALDELRIWFGDPNYGAECRADDLQPILDGVNLAGLRRLGLMNAEFTDELCRVLPGAAVLPQLQVLDLSMGTLSDEGGRVLVENHAAFAHLEELNLGRSYLSDLMATQLSERLPQAKIGPQRFPDDGRRFVSAGE